MTFREFLIRLIDEERVELLKDFVEKTQVQGGLAGLRACKDKSPPELAHLLKRAYFARQDAFHRTVLSRYHWINAFFWEVEWICNVVSVILVNQEIDPIIQPSMRAALVAQRISNSFLPAN